MRTLAKFTLAAVFCVAPLCGQTTAGAQTAANPNVLTAEEQASGWRLLFDGKSMEGWRSFRKAAVEADRWSVEDGCLHLYARSEQRRVGGDLITTETFGNFEFAFEWMAGGGANSGVKYLIDEYFAPNKNPVSFEYQIQVEEDPTKPKRRPLHSTGALYDMLPPAGGVLRPHGTFNESRIVVQGMHVEHWLNGEKLLEFDRSAAPFRELVARSKFWKWPGFGLNERGHIGLQDHGNEVWFRRVRVRSLSSPTASTMTSSTRE
jgi:hypothetical protein